MGFESNTGLGVVNHYGPRDTGGTRGVVKTEGIYNEFTIRMEAGIDHTFPVDIDVIGVEDADAGATVTALTIGGVDVVAATEGSPVNVPAGNTGVIVVTGGGTTGFVLVKYKKLAG